jgi:hypothetical protein
MCSSWKYLMPKWLFEASSMAGCFPMPREIWEQFWRKISLRNCALVGLEWVNGAR